MRRVVIGPGGVIAAHPHANRPAIVYISTGRLLEFRTDREEAVEHVAPAVVVPAAEHWWRNPGDEDAVIIGADLLDPASDPAQG
ncbi:MULTISPECIES: cupin domain-containing protein [unclassified Microbacterium]|uniref:cupin domain-containing protein n=1 Tax=unclassified Microbacterium TaxID=2609290 RepID=UPI000EAA5F52|nr:MULTISPECIES: cupin domain-containing protein [unclassified Microbacterium]MBT2484482.1 cupin domain-containing protein [Microbacterium sp. ISL-108]RKN67388.1 cupin domain-containing protein [Microbacterium sp. CGR2]